jgi:capsular polysaccharide biosynthesis protein
MELRQYVNIIWKWLWLIVLATVIAAGSSYYASRSMPRIYQTSTTLMVGQTIQNRNASGQDIWTSQQLAEAYAQVAIRQAVLQGVADALGFESWEMLKCQRQTRHPFAGHPGRRYRPGASQGYRR